jgi:hypothetical protein
MVYVWVVITQSKMYQPPIVQTPIFNPTFFSANTEALTIEKADQRYLSLGGGFIGGSLSINGTLLVGGQEVVAPPSYVVGITPGTAANNKVLVLDGSGSIATIASLTAMNIYGCIKTAAQHNITSLGTLSGLTISAANSTSNASIMSEYPLRLVNPNSTNGLQVGMVFGVSANLPSLYSGGASIVHRRSDTNSAGSLLFNIRSSPVASDPLVESFRINQDASLSINYPMTIDGNLSFSGASRVISGLSSISATTLTGALSSAAQPAITSIGTLSALTIGGNLTFTGASRVITGLSSISATTLTGTLSTAAQNGITSVGTLSSLTVSGASSLGAVQIAGTEVITSSRHIQNVGDITCSSVMNAFLGYQLNGATLVDSTQNIFATSINAAYVQLAKAAGSVYSSTQNTNQYNLALSNSSNTSTPFSGLAFHVDTGSLGGSTPGACIISEIDTTTAYEGSNISFLTKGTAGSASALTKHMTIMHTRSINFGAGTSTDGDLSLLKPEANALFRFGTARVAKNSISMSWNYSGYGLDTNRLSFDIYGTTGTLVLTANFRVAVGTTGPESRFHVIGTPESMYGSWQRVQEWWSSRAISIKVGLLVYAEAPGGDNGATIGTYTNDSFRIMTGGSNRVEITSGGYLGVGIDPESHFHSVGGSWCNAEFHSKNNSTNAILCLRNATTSYCSIGSYNTNPASIRLGTCNASMNPNGYCPVYGGAYSNASDERLKRDIVDIEYGITEVMRMKPRSFTWRQDGKRSIGFIAQELNTVLQEPVSIPDDPDTLNEDGLPCNGWSVDYACMVSVLCKAIQEQ